MPLVINAIPADFFETFPLYKAYTWEGVSAGMKDPEKLFTPISLICDICNSLETFHRYDFQIGTLGKIPRTIQVDLTNYAGLYRSAGMVLAVWYVCVSCREFECGFMIRIGDDCRTVKKVGQYPPWSISVESAVARVLGSHIGDYRKGLVNESQGYGIGAFAYYRRIVEVLIDGLLADVGGLLEGQTDHAVYMAKLANVKASHAADVKIEVVKDLIPLILRQGGINPLSVLHDALSQGLHAGSDEECLTLAGLIRESLVFLIENVTAAKRKAKAYSASIETLKKKLDQKGGTKINPK